MSSCFVPGSHPGTLKNTEAYAAYTNGYRARLANLIAKDGLQAGYLVRRGLATGASIGASLQHYRAAAVWLGPELFARSNHWHSGAFGKIHALLGGRQLLTLKMLRSTPSYKSGATCETPKHEAQREVALLKKYVSPQARLYFDSQTQKHGIVMEMLAGSMADFRDHHFFAGAAEERVVCMLKHVLGQLCQMHADKVWHLDIKSGNIMAFSDGRIRACDMGLARFADEVPEMGTMAYLAPEALHSAEGSMRGKGRDIWALGLSALEGFMPLESTPFHSANIFGIYGVMNRFLTWHESMRTAGKFDISKLTSDASDNKFTKTFQALFEKSPEMCALLAGHFLVPGDMRVSAHDGLRLCNEAFPGSEQAERAWGARVQSWSEHQDFRRVHKAALRLRLQDEKDARL